MCGVRHLVLLPLIFGLAACDTNADDVVPDGSVTKDSGVDICDLDAFTGNGNACRAVSNRVCFPLCDAGGCRCVQGSSGPVWKCVNDFSCYPDGGPLDDSGSDEDGAATDASPVDASDAKPD